MGKNILADGLWTSMEITTPGVCMHVSDSVYVCVHMCVFVCVHNCVCVYTYVCACTGSKATLKGLLERPMASLIQLESTRCSLYLNLTARMECLWLVWNVLNRWLSSKKKRRGKWQNILESGPWTSRHLLPPSLPSSYSPPPSFAPLLLVFLR